MAKMIFFVLSKTVFELLKVFSSAQYFTPCYICYIHLSWHSLRVHHSILRFTAFFHPYECVCLCVSVFRVPMPVLASICMGTGFFTWINPCWRQTLCGLHAYAQRTGRYRRIRLTVCIFCVVCQATPHHCPVIHSLFHFAFNLSARWMGRNFLSCFICLSVMSLYSQSASVPNDIMLMCTFKMLFIYCNLVARHFVNVYDIFTFIKKLWNIHSS